MFTIGKSLAVVQELYWMCFVRVSDQMVLSKSLSIAPVWITLVFTAHKPGFSKTLIEQLQVVQAKQTMNIAQEIRKNILYFQNVFCRTTFIIKHIWRHKLQSCSWRCICGRADFEYACWSSLYSTLIDKIFGR